MHGFLVRGSHYFGGQQSTECRQAACRTDSPLSEPIPRKSLARSPRKPLTYRRFTEAATETANAPDCVVVLPVQSEPVSANFDRKQGINREITPGLPDFDTSRLGSRHIFNGLQPISLLLANREFVNSEEGMRFTVSANMDQRAGLGRFYLRRCFRNVGELSSATPSSSASGSAIDAQSSVVA